MNKRTQPDLLNATACDVQLPESVELTPEPGVGAEKSELQICVSDTAVRHSTASHDVENPTSQEPEPGIDDPDFDWLNSESVVVPEQQAVAIYFNPNGELVIRQERSWSDEYDHFIVIHQRNAQQFLDKLCDALGIGSAGA
jgi:hypothetical protein